jgi:CTP:molybdopterin cytidylyltransferase MocA
MPDRAPLRHGVVVLAAGRSQRLGLAKQLLCIDGETLVHRATRLGLGTAPADCVVVCAQVPGAVSEALADLACRCLPCVDAAQGMSASLRCALRALSPECAAALILLTDQPHLDAAHLQALLAGWGGATDRAAASAYGGCIGVPAVLPRSWFADLEQLDGDTGARALLRARRAEVCVVEAAQLAADIDSPDDLDKMNSLRASE